jgi:hypothetical protein
MLKFAVYVIGFLIISCIIKFSVINIIQATTTPMNITTTITTLHSPPEKQIKLPTLQKGPELYAVESELETEEDDEAEELGMMGYDDEEIEVELEDLHYGEDVE